MKIKKEKNRDPITIYRTFGTLPRILTY